MAYGGYREGAGRKKAQHTILAEKMRADLTKRVNEEFAPIIIAQINEAKGLYYEAIDKEGKKHIYTKLPNPKCAEYLLNQAIGRPKESVELSGPGGEAIRLDVRIANALKKVYGS